MLHSRSEVLSERGAQDRGPVVEINVVQRVQIAPFPTKCAFCGGEAEEGKKLQRCGTCKAVGYCDRLERSKQGQTSNKAKQHNTPKAVTFPKQNELPQVDMLER